MNRERKTLSHVQGFQLMTFLKEKSVLVERLPDSRIANVAAKELGFPIKESHVYVRRTAMGITKHRGRKSNSDKYRRAIMEICARLEVGGFFNANDTAAVAAIFTKPEVVNDPVA